MTQPGRYPVPALSELDADIRERIESVQQKSGFVPNVFLVLAHRPDEFRAFFAYHDAVMLRASNLSRAEREMIVVATSAANDCTYCVIAHGAILRIYAKDPLIADQIATNYRSAPLSDRQLAMLRFAVKLGRTPQELTDADYAQLREQGFTEEDVWDIAAITGLFALSNRMAHVSGMEANEEFYSMGR
jgi:4-carboxymuconolactone decarboxylase